MLETLKRNVRKLLGIQTERDLFLERLFKETNESIKQYDRQYNHDDDNKDESKVIRRISGRLTTSASYSTDNTITSNRLDLGSSPTFSFTIHSADNGLIIEVRRRTRNDEYEYDVYLCREDEELDKKLSEIITIQSLKR